MDGYNIGHIKSFCQTQTWIAKFHKGHNLPIKYWKNGKINPETSPDSDHQRQIYTPLGHECNSSTLLLQSVGYTKMEDDTALRINLDFLIRLTTSNHNTQACTAWYIHVSSHLLMQAAFSYRFYKDNKDYLSQTNKSWNAAARWEAKWS